MNAKTDRGEPVPVSRTSFAVVHLTSYTFAPDSHPAVYRTVTGLAGHARALVLYKDTPGYQAAKLERAECEWLRRLGIDSGELNFSRLKKPREIGRLAAGIRGRYGRVGAVIGHLGNNGWRAIALGRALGAPVLTYFHGRDAGSDLRKPEYRWRYQQLSQAPAATFLAVSRNIAQGLLSFGMAPERTFVHHLGIDLERRSPPERRASTGNLEVVLAGRLIEIKGHAFALEAFAGLCAEAPGSRLHLFGDGPLRERLVQSAQELGVGDRILFHGTVSSEALFGALARADVALQPSVLDEERDREGLPNTVLEAMAMALPVVATRHGGIPEAVVDGETGLLVPERDPEALAQALLRLSRDAELRLRLGSRGRQRVEDEFDARRRGEVLAARLQEMQRSYRRLRPWQRARAWQRASDGLLLPRPSRSYARLAWDRIERLRLRQEGRLALP